MQACGAPKTYHNMWVVNKTLSTPFTALLYIIWLIGQIWARALANREWLDPVTIVADNLLIIFEFKGSRLTSRRVLEIFHFVQRLKFWKKESWHGFGWDHSGWISELWKLSLRGSYSNFCKKEAQFWVTYYIFLLRVEPLKTFFILTVGFYWSLFLIFID